MLGWELPPHNSGGLGVACFQMSKALADSGVELDFVVPYSARHENINFMKIHSAVNISPLEKFGEISAYGNSDLHSSSNSPKTQKALKSIRDIQRIYVDFIDKMITTSGRDFDAIHAHDWLTMEAGIKAKEKTGLPLIVHVHATEFDRSGGSFGNSIIHDIEYQGLLMADKIFAVSELTKQIIINKYSIPAEKIEVVYNAIDVNDLPIDSSDENTYKYINHLKNQGYTVVGTVTRFTVQKGLDKLMQAAALAVSKNDKCVFLFAGDGEQRDELLQMSADLGISDKVFFTGFVRGKKWRDAFSVMDVFVMSSVSEPFGLTALEAAHYDNALIISYQSGVGEVLKSIFRFDFWDTHRLADQIVGIASSESLKKEMKNNIKHEYLKISWQDVATQCKNSYQLLKERRI